MMGPRTRTTCRYSGILFGATGGGALRVNLVAKNHWPSMTVIIVSIIILNSSGPQHVTAVSNYTQSTTVSSNLPPQQTSTASVQTKPNYLETGRQITGILNGFMSLGYDKRVRPNYGGPPVAVNVTMRILSISSVSEVMMDFTADFYFRQFWHDPRLAFKKLGDIQTLYVGAEVSKKIWLPDTFFGNEKMAYFHEATTPNVFLRIDHSGEVYRSIRLTVTSSCPMNLQYFPMDRQRCTIEAESYGYNIKDIIYRWAHDTAVEQDGQISLPQFDIVRTIQKYRLENLSSGTYSRLIAEIHFARRMGYYLIQIYIPSSLIVVISWVSFWLHRNASPARVQLGVTTVLTMTTLMSSTNAALPKISYVKSIDIFLGTCFVMVFAALLEYATVGYLGKRIAMRKAHAQHAQTQAQARLFAHLQAQGAQGEPVPLATAPASATGAAGPTSGSADANAAEAAAAAGASLGIFGSSPEFPVEPIHTRHLNPLHMQASSLATLLERDSNPLAPAGKLPQASSLLNGRDNNHQHRHQHQHYHHHLDQQRPEADPCKCQATSCHALTDRAATSQQPDLEHDHKPTCGHHQHQAASCSHAGQRHAQHPSRTGGQQHCAHGNRLPALPMGAAEPEPPPRKGFKNSLDATRGFGLAPRSCHQCQHGADESREIQTLPRNLEFQAAGPRAHDLYPPLSSGYKDDTPRQPTAGSTCCRPHQPPSYCGPGSAPVQATSISSALAAPGASGLTNWSSPSKGASAAAAAAAATFVNLHRRNKGLPPSTNPNLTQFSSILNPTYNRHLETIFGIRPSDIDKYSRVVFPVCFVCFQLMYWIVYLHISAFLEPDQHSQQQPPQLPVQQPVTTM